MHSFNNSVNFRCEHAREFFHRRHHPKLLRIYDVYYRFSEWLARWEL